MIRPLDKALMLRRARCAFVLAACGLFPGCVGTNYYAGPLVTKQHIRAVHIGMSRTEVEQMLGVPLTVESDPADRHVVLTYTRRPTGVRYFPMLWVHMSDDRVREVYVKRYGFWLMDDDIGVYGRGSVDFERPEFAELFPD